MAPYSIYRRGNVKIQTPCIGIKISCFKLVGLGWAGLGWVGNIIDCINCRSTVELPPPAKVATTLQSTLLGSKKELTFLFYLFCLNVFLTCMLLEMESLSLSISCKCFVPRMFLRVVWASSLVEWWAFSTFATEIVAFDTR